MRSRREIFDEILQQGFPRLDRVGIMGSTVMELAGIRAGNDIDLITDDAENIAYIEHLLVPERGWVKIDNQFPRMAGDKLEITSFRDRSEHHRFEVWPHAYDPSLPDGQRHISVEQLQSDHDAWQSKRTGVWVMGKERLRKMKFALGGEKNLTDVILLGTHQIRNS